MNPVRDDLQIINISPYHQSYKNYTRYNHNGNIYEIY